MQVYGQLQNAAIESLAADPAASTQGRIYFNTANTKLILDDGTNKRALLRNDQFAVFGNHATAANNIRFQRGGNTVLQLVAGNDATAEGTLSTSLAQLSARHEVYTFSGKPAVGNPGRVIFASDIASLLVDTGTVWSAIGGGGGGGGGATWQPVNGSAAVEDFTLSEKAWNFTQGALQQIELFLRVPTGYVSGKAVTMKLGHVSPSASNAYRFQTTATLVRQNTDAVTSTANQRLSTTGDQTNTISQMYKNVSYDITDASGAINGVSITAGDLIIVVLTRIAPTATEDTAVVSVLPSMTEVLYS